MKRAGGFSLVAAIFLLVILSSLGAFIVTVSTTQSHASALDVLGARAYRAARAGIEWGAYSQLALQRSHGPTYASCAPEFSSNGTFGFAGSAATLGGFTVTVSCTAYGDGHGGPTVYELISTACNQVDPGSGKCPNLSNPGGTYVERRLQAIL